MSVFLKGTRYAKLEVSWKNPYTQPPGGRPRVIWSACIPWPYEGEYLDLIPCHRCENYFACGYGPVLSPDGDTNPPRGWSPEAKARRRIANLRRRIIRKAPLFVEEYLAREIAKKPDYYNAETIAQQPTGADIIAKIEQERDEFLTACFSR